MFDANCLLPGTRDWMETEVSASMNKLLLKHLMRNIIYQICVAEKWSDESKPFTTFTVPVDIRLGDFPSLLYPLLFF